MPAPRTAAEGVRAGLDPAPRTAAEGVRAGLDPDQRAAAEGVRAGLDPAPRAAAEGVLAGLDPDQRAAAEVTRGPLLVVAGPGTGKTRTLTRRIAHLVGTGVAAPENCLAITFTRRAADEMRERLTGLLPGVADRVTVCTFHALGLRILREQADLAGLEPGFRIADEAERLALVRTAFGDHVPRRDARRLLAEVSRLTRAGLAVPGASTVDSDTAGALARYRAGKRSHNLVDLDDLVALPVALLGADPAMVARYRDRWPHISVDEYQDVDETQYRLLRLLCPPDGNLCAIGDPDQAIYGFRGADVGFFLRYRADFPAARVVPLSRNYRSSPAIVTAAVQAIAPVTLVPDRVLTPVALTPDAPTRVAVHVAADERAEAGYVVGAIDRLLGGSSFLALDRGRVVPGHEAGHSYADVAVLYRTDAQARALVDALEAAGVPYQKRSHHRLADQPGVREILAAVRAATAADPTARPVTARLRAAAATVLPGAAGPATPTVLGPAAATAPGDGAATASGDPAATAVGAPAPEEAEIRSAVEMLTPVAERAGTDTDRFLAELALGAEVDLWDPRADRISLLTLHAAKGLEFPVVFVVGCEDGLLPLRWGPETSETDETDEERRLLFVGMTRARTHLVLTLAGRRADRDTRPSPFLAAVDETLLERSSRQAKRRNVQLRLM